MAPKTKTTDPAPAPAALLAAMAPDQNALMIMLSQDATMVRDMSAAVLRRWRWIAKVGAAGLQGEPWNLSEADAEALVAQFNLVATPALVYYGETPHGDPPQRFDIDDALILVRGPS